MQSGKQQPYNPLSSRIPAGVRNIYRSDMGKRVVGKILGMGPERGMGTHNDADLLFGTAYRVYPFFQKSDVLPPFLHTGFYLGADHLFRGKLYTWRYAQLCVSERVMNGC